MNEKVQQTKTGNALQRFLKRKNIIFSAKRYGIDALGAMAQGLFASLLIGTIIGTLGEQIGSQVLVDAGAVFGYTDSKKVDLNVLSKHIRDMMTQNRLSYSTVKFYQDYKVFLSRIEGLESIAMVENAKINGEEEAQTRQLLLNLSM